MTCNADLFDPWQHSIHPKQCVALASLNVHLQKSDILDPLLLANIFERARSYSGARRSVGTGCNVHCAEIVPDRNG